MDVTNAAQIREAVKKVESLDILIHNADRALYDDLGGVFYRPKEEPAQAESHGVSSAS